MTQRLDPLVVLAARIGARAVLWKAGQFASLDDMMQPLYAYAIEKNVFEQMDGADGIDRLMLEALTALPRPGGKDGG